MREQPHSVLAAVRIHPRRGARRRLSRPLPVLAFALLMMACVTGQATDYATNIARGAVWHYYDADPALQATNWAATAFDYSSWSSGPAMLGYEEIGDPTYTNFATRIGYGPEETNKYMTAYFRHAFVLTNQPAIKMARILLRRDDGAVVHLNGSELLRDNMPAGPVTYSTPARVKAGSANNATYWEHFFPVNALVEGTNLVAVEVHQYNPTSSDLRFDLSLETAVTVTVSLVRGPYLQTATPNEITVRWRTDWPADSRVRYGLEVGQLSSVVTQAGERTEHSITLTNLLPATRYYYAIGHAAGDWAGDDTQHYFQTPPIPGSPKATRIWAIGDSGTSEQFDQGRSADGQIGYLLSEDLYRQYLALSSNRYTDVWLLLGDNGYPQGTDAQYQASFFDKYPELLRQSPVWPCPGNHEFYNGMTFSATETGPYYDIFSPPRAGEAGGVASGTEAYYSFDFANIHFISLDSHNTARGTNGVMYLWLENDLASTLQEWIIAFWHHPPYTKGSHNSDNPNDSSRRMHDMRERFLPLFEKYGTDLVLCGHSHSYERSFLLKGHYGLSTTLTNSMIMDGGDGREDGDGAYAWSQATGTVYAVCGSSGKIGSFNNDLDHPVMVTSMWEHGSIVLDVAGARLDGMFLDDEGNARDRFTILHDAPHTDDLDSDGLPDWWERWYFGHLDEDGEGDGDGDRVTNGDEYRGGTHPTNAASVLRFRDIEQDRATGAVALGWEGTPGRHYTLHASSNLLSTQAHWHPLSPTGLSVTVYGPLEYRVPLTNGSPRYYRLEATPATAW